MPGQGIPNFLRTLALSYKGVLGTPCFQVSRFGNVLVAKSPPRYYKILGGHPRGRAPAQRCSVGHGDGWKQFLPPLLSSFPSFATSPTLSLARGVVNPMSTSESALEVPCNATFQHVEIVILVSFHTFLKI